MSDQVSLKKRKQHKSTRTDNPSDNNDLTPPREANAGHNLPGTSDQVKKKKKKKKKRVNPETVEPDVGTERSPLGQPYTDASAFISSLGGKIGPSQAGSGSDAITVVQNFDSTQIQNALRHLQQASGSEPPPRPAGKAIVIPVAGSHSSQPQQPQRRTRPPPHPIRPGSYADIPPPIDQRPVSSQAIASSEETLFTSQSMQPSAESIEKHRSILTEKWLSTGQLNEMAKTQGLVYKKGKFSRIEDQQLEFAIEDFRKKNALNELDIEKIIFAEDRNKGNREQSLDFWSSITAALYQRPIVAVYHHLRRIRNPMRQGEGGTGLWSPEQDEALLQAVEQHGPAWEKVSKIVLRAASDCRDRYRNHLCESERNRATGKWSKEEEGELIRIVQEMKVKLGYKDGDEIFWGRVSEKMGGRRGKQQCRAKWHDQLRRTVEGPDESSKKWTPYDNYILINKVDSLDVRHDSEIEWSKFPDCEWTFSPHVIQKKWRSLKSTIDGWENMTHTELVEVLRSKNAKAPIKHAARRSRVGFKSSEFIDPDLDAEDDLDTALEAGFQQHEATADAQPAVESAADAPAAKRPKKKKSSKSADQGAVLEAAVGEKSSTTATVPEEARSSHKKKKKHAANDEAQINSNGPDVSVAKPKKRKHTAEGATEATADTGFFNDDGRPPKRKKKSNRKGGNAEE